jgi:two-component system chemotaxis response regulator CheY
MHAMIVDDSRAMRHILRKILEPLGFQIAEAGHGIAGLQYLSAHPEIELVLVDWNMPQMNGIDFIRAVRANEVNERMKLVMVTTEMEPAKMARALMAGADEFLMKPFTPEMLLDKLQLIGVSIPMLA